MFGIIRPCRNRLGNDLRRDWMAHLCGLCLTLRDEHGQAARFVTNYDAIAISALVEAQTGVSGHRRQAGPCPLRGMRPASVAEGDGARLAASVSLLLAAAKLHDHVEDGDVAGLRARATGRVADRLATAGIATGGSVALDTSAVLDTIAQQTAAERNPTSLLEVTAPTEAATSLAFRHTAVVAGRPENADALAEAGRLFGRLAHLLDAVEDVHADRAAGAWNPITALGLHPDEVRRHCDDAVLGVRLALRDATFVDGRLVHVLLAHELESAVKRTFTTAGHPPPLTPPLPPGQQPPGPQPPGPQPPAGPPHWEAPPPVEKKGIAGCLATVVACGTCQACSQQNQGDDEDKQGCCSKLGDCCSGCCDCGDCCDCCSCCDC